MEESEEVCGMRLGCGFLPRLSSEYEVCFTVEPAAMAGIQRTRELLVVVVTLSRQKSGHCFLELEIGLYVLSLGST
jgi:hypothetical protein